jgi:hypothetical protein
MDCNMLPAFIVTGSATLALVVAADAVGLVAYSAALREVGGGRHDAANRLA